MKKILAHSTVVLMILCLSGIAWCEGPRDHLRIALLVNETGEKTYQKLVKKEIRTLLESRYTIAFEVKAIDVENRESTDGLIRKLMNDEETDCIIGLGIDTSEALVGYKDYKKPVIAAAVLDRRLQGLPMTKAGSSGIDNFNYIESPFDVEKDLATFKKIYNFRHLAVLINSRETFMYHNLFSYLGRAVKRISPEAKLSVVEIYPDKLEESMAALPDDVDSVYLPPVFLQDEYGEQKKLIDMINGRKLPSFALLGEESVQMGAMASIAPDRNLNAMSRRIAINVLNIFSGENAGSLPVEVKQYVDNYVINVGTLNQIDFFPAWEAMNEARLINFEKGLTGRQINLNGVIAEALQANLAFQLEKLNTSLQNQEIDIASARLYPQLSFSTSLTTLDENRADAVAGSPARHTWSASGSLSQVIYSDDLIANYAIQGILLESQKYQEKTSLLDTVISAAESYINLLFARSNRTIQNNNLAVTRKNLDIARNKEAVGSIGASEVHRWESELSSNQISLNDAYRDVQLARMALNNILNRPLKEEFIVEDIEPDDSVELLITDPKVYRYLSDFKRMNSFGMFLLDEAENNLPELRKVEENIKAQKRDILNRQRAHYLPDIQIRGEIDKIVDEYDTTVETPSDLDHPWTIAAIASWPLYTGGSRRHELEKSRIQLRQITLQEDNLRNQLNLRVRSNLETAAVSAREIALSRSGLQSAQKNFEIIQAGYSEGRNSIADLIDAQNAKINAERGEAVAKYQFVLDFLKLERSIGRFHFLDTPEGKQAFILRLNTHMEGM